MKSYYRVMLGKKSAHAEECFKGGFIGADFGIDRDLTKKLPDEWRTFNKEFVPIYLESHRGKSKVTAGLSCGFLWTVAKGMREGDIVLSPTGTGVYKIGEMAGGYAYHPGQNLPHRRPVKWFAESIDRSAMSVPLRNSAGSIGTVCNVTRHREEIERLLEGKAPPKLIATDETVEDPSVFALEEHLSEFLVANWGQMELGKSYDIYEEDGERVGVEYETDTGPMDILAISKDGMELLVVELKKGRTSDAVVGQIQRYMGYVLEELAEPGQRVKGIIIALDDDKRIRRALAVAKGIDFYRYQVSFKLMKA